MWATVMRNSETETPVSSWVEPFCSKAKGAEQTLSKPARLWSKVQCHSSSVVEGCTLQCCCNCNSNPELYKWPRKGLSTLLLPVESFLPWRGSSLSEICLVILDSACLKTEALGSAHLCRQKCLAGERKHLLFLSSTVATNTGLNESYQRGSRFCYLDMT